MRRGLKGGKVVVVVGRRIFSGIGVYVGMNGCGVFCWCGGERGV